ncbi:MAG: glycosyltransferase [Sphingobacteriaceae bacterium]|nr:glycosyltransferase [Sphingobacteriaceae bacterium]
MSVEYYILFGILFLYALLLSFPILGFAKSEFVKNDSDSLNEPISIIICARNEEKNIPRCLKTILHQQYDLSKLQIILIDDASTDSTVNYAQAILKVSGINYKIIQNKKQLGKKRSILQALQLAEYELIITRDADTYTLSDEWLYTISDFYTKHKCDMIIGPVAISQNSGALWALQAIENDILNVLSCGMAKLKKPFLCSGANLIFTKTAFKKAGSYQSHLAITSGDDVLFLEDLKKTGAKISYLKSNKAVVYTYPCPNIKSLFLQKIRWANKFSSNKNYYNNLLAFVTLLTNISVLFCILNAFLVAQNATFGLIFIGIKLVIDNLLLFLASRFLKTKGLTMYILPVALVYPVYVLLISLLSIFIKPNWK